MRSTFKVLFYVKKGSEKPNGNLPLMCRITADGVSKQYICKIDVAPRLVDAVSYTHVTLPTKRTGLLSTADAADENAC